MILASKICLDCINKQQCTEGCDFFTFYNNYSFCEWLFGAHNANFTAIAHNAGKFDAIFLLKYIVQSFISIYAMPEIICNGTKILSLVYKDVRVIDSLNFLPMPLEKFAKTFNLNALKKGFFPHRFNTIENQNYEGVLPPREYYEPDFFHTEKRQEFNTWYALNQNKTYNFKQELFDYCKSDVYILREACLSFRDIIFKQTGICPFSSTITIASLSHLIYRTQFLPSKSIAIIPEYGYNMEQ